MRYVFDHDLHIHSGLSLCSGNPEQSPERILSYAKANKLSTICLTDHYWDDDVPGPSDWYRIQNYAHIAQALPLPQAENVRFLFGCETELRADLTVGVSEKGFDKFDFVIIPTTHMHMNGFTVRGDEDAKERAELYVSRLDGVLDQNLPFHKIGIAHLTCGLMYDKDPDSVMNLVSDEALSRLFRKAVDRGVGIELNFDALDLTGERMDTVLRPYRIAKAEGCKFYFGSDAHQPEELDREKQTAERIIDLLGLEESDKFRV